MTFRLTLTASLMLMIGALAALLIFVQDRTLKLATDEAATSTMDGVSARTIMLLREQVANLSRATRTLSISPSLTAPSELDVGSPATGLVKGALIEWPALDSIYVGYGDGRWLQVQRVEGLKGEQRQRLGAPPNASFAIALVHPNSDGGLATTRIFQDKDGKQIERREILGHGYDPRERVWYRSALKAGELVVSAPYLSFSLGVPMITFSAPLQGKVHGVVGADLKLDAYSTSADILKFGDDGYVVLFDSNGTVIAHRDYASMFARSSADPAGPRLPSTLDLAGSLEGKVIVDWDKSSRTRGKLRWTDDNSYFYRLESIPLGPTLTANVLLVAVEQEFAGSIRDLTFRSRIFALASFLLFIPLAWIFGTRMSKKINAITDQAARLQVMGAPPPKPIGSFIRELQTLGGTIHNAQRAIWSFARLAPREIVRGVLDNSISTELGGARQEITVLFTDVQGFTSLSEAADPDVLMQQTSRYFTALTDVIIAQGGTVDKFIGDAVMAFWNAPNLQEDHCDRACRAALLAKEANQRINRQFETEGLPPFYTRFGIHGGEAVVGNLGSAERMNYTVLGNVVNLAARLEGLNKQYGTDILISEDIFTRVGNRFHCRYVDSVVAKGMVAQTRVYELLREIQPGVTDHGSNAQSSADILNH
ncbi:hypothetical protein IVA80_05345 [Bradyrhizobium sp. 139]|uniref:adenylate/guanylate cyclase domain-containing protein n=1 Tax=Bradyrhizobium sp. 139 TaxID=2782616 RepID=UPI001FF75B50|nr:adenylate/guanylate cyclase domain-containing protein [Bradyrhizobium sp. 139]MCK1740302.1 hypothetical protein [Bradyrhizobium sp. 139]